MMSDAPDLICAQLRDIRMARNLTLDEVERRSGIKRAVVGSYERGDRIPNLVRARDLLAFYGYGLVAVPPNAVVVRTGQRRPAELWAEWAVLCGADVIACETRAVAERLAAGVVGARIVYRVHQVSEPILAESTEQASLAEEPAEAEVNE